MQFKRVNIPCGKFFLGKYNNIEILDYAGSNYYRIQCLTCGTVKTVQTATVRYNLTKRRKCYCKHSEAFRRSHTKHGMSKTKLYMHWDAMKQRCYRPKCNGYSRYGGRGVGVCPEWKNSFEKFLRDMGPSYEKGLTLDRIDNNGDYCKKNCKWSNPKEQAANREIKRNILFKGKRVSLREASQLSGVEPNTIKTRIERGWLGSSIFRKPKWSRKKVCTL